MRFETRRTPEPTRELSDLAVALREVAVDRGHRQVRPHPSRSTRTEADFMILLGLSASEMAEFGLPYFGVQVAADGDLFADVPQSRLAETTFAISVFPARPWERSGTLTQLAPTRRGIVVEFEEWLDALQREAEHERSDIEKLGEALEVIAELWPKLSPDMALTRDQREAGDAFARMLGELVKMEDRPHEPVRAVLRWLKVRVDIASDSAAEWVGKGMVVAGGAVLLDNLHSLQHEIALALRLLGG